MTKADKNKNEQTKDNNNKQTTKQKVVLPSAPFFPDDWSARAERDRKNNNIKLDL